MRRLLIITSSLLIMLFGCGETLEKPEHLPTVFAAVETESVHAMDGEDAADDPAIWINRQDSSRSMIYGSNKLLGIEAYDLSGKRQYTYEVGRVNNIDIRYDFLMADSTRLDILAGSERNENTILVFGINPNDGSLIPLTDGIESGLSEVYGFCLYKSPRTAELYAFINDKSGEVEQWELIPTAERTVKGELVRTFKVASQPEGMVADDMAAFLFVGEEGKGIWKFHAEPELSVLPEKILKSGEENENISYDIEGLAIYRKKEKSYLLASSQGNHTYAVFSLEEGYPYLGSFIVGEKEVDGSEETDGIEVSAADLGGEFSEGIFIAQDGYNYTVDGKKEPQNFKLVSWTSIGEILK